MKKILFLLLILICIFIIILKSGKINENKLYCDENGDFTVLIVSDPQCDTKKQWIEARDELQILINRSNPDIVIINGDMNSKNQISVEMWNLFISPIVNKNIYLATTNGNHDPFLKKNYEIYSSYEKCLNSTVSKGNLNYEAARPMNYVIPIYSNDKKSIVFAIYGMDTGTGNKYGYEGLTKKQINWYKEQSNNLKKKNNGNNVTSVVCMHIPLTQTIDMFYSGENKNATAKKTGGKYSVFGVTNQVGSGITDYVCENGTFVKESFIHATAPQNDRDFFDAVLKQGDVKAIIFGHEHKTNLVGSYNGVLLGFAGKLSTGCYSDTICRGGRIIKFNQENPQKFTTEWLGSMPSSKDQPKIYSDGSIAK